MRREDFASIAPGSLVRTLGGVHAFAPNPLPATLALNLPTVTALAKAENALGLLNGTTSRLVDPLLVWSPLLRREAIISSRIEGTLTTPEQLSLLEALGPTSATAGDTDTKEVINYIGAMMHGLGRLAELPVCLRLIRELHEKLMDGVRGSTQSPGEFRTIQNWIGTKGRPIAEARFVPPPVSQMNTALQDLETYLHAESEMPLLVILALVHYQFETIHPFCDGNGRVGRLLIPLLLMSRGRLPQPILYLSSFFEQNFTQYADLMLRVSTQGAWFDWIRFFLAAVESSALDSVAKAQRLLQLRDQWHQEFQSARRSGLLQKLVDQLLRMPSITIPQAARLLGVTYPAAAANVKKLVQAGILRPVTLPGATSKAFLASAVLDVIRDAQQPAQVALDAATNA